MASNNQKLTEPKIVSVGLSSDSPDCVVLLLDPNNENELRILFTPECALECAAKLEKFAHKLIEAKQGIVHLKPTKMERARPLRLDS